MLSNLIHKPCCFFARCSPALTWMSTYSNSMHIALREWYNAYTGICVLVCNQIYTSFWFLFCGPDPPQIHIEDAIPTYTIYQTGKLLSPKNQWFSGDGSSRLISTPAVRQAIDQRMWSSLAVALDMGAEDHYRGIHIPYTKWGAKETH